MTDAELDAELERRGLIVEPKPAATIALAMVGRSSVSFEVLKQWIGALREVHWPGPTFIMPEIYAAGEWIGVVPLRNLCTYQALKDKSWDYLLWIDADHKVNHLIFARLQEHARARRAVVGGLYYMRGYPHEVNAFGERKEDGVMFIQPSLLVPSLKEPGGFAKALGQDAPPGATWPVIPVAGVGTGTMLIRRDILERMAEVRGEGNVWHAGLIPWQQQVAFLERDEKISGVMSEDILFCLEVEEFLQEQVWLDLDPRMETGHQGEQTVDRRHYLAAHEPLVPPGTDLGKLKLPKGYEVVEPKR
jgi:hypothetical protein